MLQFILDICKMRRKKFYISGDGGKKSYQTQKDSFMQLGFNLSNKVTDTLESSSKLIYFETRKIIYTW